MELRRITILFAGMAGLNLGVAISVWGWWSLLSLFGMGVMLHCMLDTIKRSPNET